MKKIIAALVTASVIATASLGASTSAEAHGPGPAFGIAAGIIGGLAVGSIIAASQNHYDDGYVVVHHRDYYEPTCHDVRFETPSGHHYWKQICD